MAQKIKFTNKGFLREHPYGDPLVSTTPVQTHSYIFPGDEITFYHKLILPDDAATAGATKIADIKFISAKVSVIAIKPQVFSEEFSEQFLSTRTFELDSFSTFFNSANAPVAMWGSDGYAPALLTQLDRPFKLPANDFHREIKFFTKHTPSTSKWSYYFYYPILFRWESWLAKLNVSLDFFDTSQAQNGLNEFWYHYFTSTWGIRTRLELNVLVNGNAVIIQSELNLSQYINSINTYNGNSDWTNKSIKTAKGNDTPTNSPAFVYGNKDTAVYAEFNKVSAWGADEQGKISGVLWVEPTNGGGVTARTRASSLYPVGKESVFKGLDTSISDDSGTGITDDNGDYVTISQNGDGVLVWFDNKKVTLFGIIDYKKLNAIYPGTKDFTIYARLYNGEIITSGNILEVPLGQNKKGEEIKESLKLVSAFADNDLCGIREPNCPFNILVFADLDDADIYKNDKTGFYGEKYCADAQITDIALTLQKSGDNCGGDWEDVIEISDNTYGDYFAFGKKNDFSGDDYEDDYGKKYTGILLNWRTVLQDHGAGTYRMKITKTDTAEATTDDYDQRIFCLKAYHCNLANRTVRIETINQGIRGSLFNSKMFIDYMDGWTDQIRLKGILTYNESEYEEEYNEYGDGSFNLMRPVRDSQRPKYTLSIRPIPGWMDHFISTNILQADEIYITDFNSLNRGHSLIEVPLKKAGGYKPNDYKLASPSADVQIPMMYAQNNLRRKN
jgi:hypothetical protein